VLFGYYMSGAFVTSLVLALQMPSANLGGYTKRVTATCLVFIAYCTGNIIGPHAFLAKESPTYKTGCKVILACASTQMALAICIRLLLISRNKKRDAAMVTVTTADGQTNEDAVEEIGADLTDYEVYYFTSASFRPC